MSDADTSIVQSFNAAINGRDVAGLTALMSDSHRFIDTAGTTVDGKQQCTEAWRQFFAAFPDYRNVFSAVESKPGGVVEIVGYSECSVPELAGPARWRAVVDRGLVTEWRVFALD